MTDTLQARLAEALAPIANPRTGASIYQTQQVRDIAATRDGKVRVTLLLAAQDDPTLARQVRRALEKVEGVVDVRVDVKDATEVSTAASAAAPAALPTAAPGKTRSALPMMDAPQQAPRTAAPTPVGYPRLGRIVAVSSVRVEVRRVASRASGDVVDSAHWHTKFDELCSRRGS